VRDLDASGLRTLLEHASVAMTSFALRSELLVPLMQEIGERWKDGELRVAHEHVASAAVRSFLGSWRPGAGANGSGPVLVVGTPAGTLHEFGALIAADSARDLGWNVVYVGSDVPAEEFAAVVASRQAAAVALSIVYPGLSAPVREELLRLRRVLGEEILIAVGGAAAAEYSATLQEIDAAPALDLDSFQEFLARAGRRTR
jgi:methanogenic corrinoid protein MtbC1